MLADLDELILKCRDERARAYIREAVACCKVGAYRSAIVSTWIAVVFDIIDKIRELALTGDSLAKEIVESLDNTIATNDLSASLAFERRLLDTARDSFELLSAQEHLDLTRLQEDRHRCAHPSLVSTEHVFSPPAEMARMHVRHAVEHLLQYEPAQGKAALERLKQEIFSDYFPVTVETATQVLTNGPLRRARKALVRNFIVLMLKSALKPPTEDYRQNMRNRAALLVVSEMQPAIWQDTLAADVTRLVRPLSTPDELEQCIHVLSWHRDLASALDIAQQIRLQEFTRNLPTKNVNVLEAALDMPMLSDAARSRVGWMSANEVARAFWLMLPAEGRKRVIDGYKRSANYEEANAWGHLIVGDSSAFEASEVREIIASAGTNPQVKDSFELAKVLFVLRSHEKLPKGEFDELVRAANLHTKQ